MILAAFGAAYGDVSALHELLQTIDDEGIQTILCTGDCAVGPNANEVIKLLRRRGVHIVQGESDRLLARFGRKRKRYEKELDSDRFAVLEQAHRSCDSECLEWLGGLPHSRTLTIDGELVSLFNGTISSPAARLDAEDPDSSFQRQREIVPAIVHVCGPSNTAFLRSVDGSLFVDPGPLVSDGSHIFYAVVDTESPQPRAEMKSCERASRSQ